MPFPLFLLIPLGVFSAIGGYNAVSGIQKSSEADDIIDYENDRNNQEYLKYHAKIEEVNSVLDELVERKIRLQTSFIPNLLKNLEIFKTVRFVPVDIFELKIVPETSVDNNLNLTSLITADEVSSDIVMAVSSGAFAGKSTLALTATYAKATTGTAIASLKGAAATKATYAALGGGALKAGGLGILGGQLILAGAVAAPVVLFGGIAMNQHGEKKLTNAESFSCGSSKFRALVEQEMIVLDGIQKRTEELLYILKIVEGKVSKYSDRLKISAKKINTEIKSTPLENLEDFLDDEDKGLIQNCVSLACFLKEMLSVTVLDEDGRLSCESTRIIVKGEKIRTDGSTNSRRLR